MMECYDSFAYFVRAFWHVQEPSKPLIWGWWMDVICEAVQRQQEGDPEYRWLLVMQPPGTAKSRILSVLAAAWVMLRWPTRKMLYVSTSDSVASRDSRFTRNVLKSEGWEPIEYPGAQPRCGYRELVRYLHDAGKRVKKGHPLKGYPLWGFAKDQDAKENFANDQTGSRLCMPMGAGATGERGDHLVIDDPVDFNKIRGLSGSTLLANMKDADDHARYLYSTRVNDRELSTRLMVMQRFDPDDPAGKALRDGHWKVICVAMEYDPLHPFGNHPRDPRRVKGEVLVGWYVDPVTHKQVVKPLQTEVLKAATIRDLGEVQYEAQYNQKPRRAAGEFVTDEQLAALEEYDADPAYLGRQCDEVMITADFTFDSTENADRVAIHAWGREGGARFYLLDRDCRRMTYVEMKAALRFMKQKWPYARRIRVEKAAAGPMIRSDLASEIPGIVLVPTGVRSKMERARVALQPLIVGRNIILPSEERAPWVKEVKASWKNMRPNGSDDDDVDAAALMGAQWGMGGVIDPQWMTAAAALSVMDGGLAAEDGQWERARGGRTYIVCASPNPATGAACAYTVVCAETGREVAAWMGVCDPRTWASELIAVCHAYNGATLVIHHDAPGTISEALRSYGRVWQDSTDVRMRPGWWRNTADMERALASTSRLIADKRMVVVSMDGRQQLLAWDGNVDIVPSPGNARVMAYLMAGDMLERFNRFRPEEREESEYLEIRFTVNDMLKEKVKRSSL